MISHQIIEAIVMTATGTDLEQIREQVVGEQRVREIMSKQFVEGHNITRLEQEMLFRNQKIEAVKLYRDRNGRCDLRVAKDAIDEYERVLGGSPRNYVATPRSY